MRSCEICGREILWNFRRTRRAPKNQLVCSSTCSKVKTDKYRANYQPKDVGRYRVFERDDFQCIYCGCSPIEDGTPIQADHIIPKSKGGLDILGNLVTSCLDCNYSKTDRELPLETLERVLKVVRERNASQGLDPNTKIKINVRVSV